MSYIEIDPKTGKFFGHRASNGLVTAGDKRCDYCGKWFSWSDANMEKYILQRRWNQQKGEPIHCGNSLCHDYHHRWLKHCLKMATDIAYRESNFIEREKRRNNIQEKDAWKLFQTLKGKGVVA